MQTPKSRWDIERAAAWLRRHAWGASGEQAGPARATGAVVVPVPASPVLAPTWQAKADAVTADQAAEPGQQHREEIDIAGWPALVAPFYD